LVATDKSVVTKLHRLDVAWATSKRGETRLYFDSIVLSLHYDPQQRYLLVGLNNGTVQEWRTTADQYVLHRDKECHSKGVKTVALLWHATMVTGSYDNSIKVWQPVGGDCPTWHLLETLHVHSDAVWDMSVVEVEAERSLLLATCGMDGRVNVFTCHFPNDFSLKYCIQGNLKRLYLFINTYILYMLCFMATAMNDQATCIAISLDFDLIVTGSGDGSKVGLWSATDGSLVDTMSGHSQCLTSARILPKVVVDRFSLGPLVITSSYDCQVRLWSTRGRICLAVLRGHRDFVRSLDCTSTRSVKGPIQRASYAYTKLIFRIASTDFGGFLRIWPVEELLSEAQQHLLKYSASKRFAPLVFLPHRSLFPHRHHITTVYIDAFRVVSGSRDRTVVLQDFWQAVHIDTKF
jgi:WD40 repeat protein